MSGSFGKQKQDIEYKDLTPKEYKRLRPFLAGIIRDLGTGGPTYEEPFAAPLTGAETRLLSDIESQARGRSPFERAAEGLTRSTLEGRYLSPDSNPFLAEYIRAAQRPVTEAFREEDLAQRALFSRAGHTIQESSPFSRAASNLYKGYMQELGDIGTRIAAGAYESERGRQAQAVDQARESARFVFERSQQALESQALPRLIQQYGVDRGLEEFRRRIALMQSILGLAGPLTSPRPVATSMSGSQWGVAFDPAQNLRSAAAAAAAGG